MEFTFIRDLKVGTKNVNLAFIVLEVGRPSTTKEGHEIRTCRVADRSGSVLLSVWGEIGSHVQPSDICRITKGYVALWKGAPTLYIGKGGELVKTGEFCFIFNEVPFMSDPTQNQQPATIPNKLESENSLPTSTAD